MREIEAQIGTQEKLSDGTVIETKFTERQLNLGTPTSTAVHEIEHGLLAQSKVKRISVVPGPGYAGITELTAYDEVAFAGPASQGRNGVEYDLSAIEYSGGNPESAKMAAAIRLSAIDEDVKTKIAAHLQAEKTLSGNQFRRAVNRFTEGEVVEIKVTNPDGIEETITQKGVKGEIIIVDFSSLPDQEAEKKEKPNNILEFPKKPKFQDEADEDIAA